MLYLHLYARQVDFSPTAAAHPSPPQLMIWDQRFWNLLSVGVEMTAGGEVQRSHC